MGCCFAGAFLVGVLCAAPFLDTLFFGVAFFGALFLGAPFLTGGLFVAAFFFVAFLGALFCASACGAGPLFMEGGAWGPSRLLAVTALPLGGVLNAYSHLLFRVGHPTGVQMMTAASAIIAKSLSRAYS